MHWVKRTGRKKVKLNLESRCAAFSAPVYSKPHGLLPSRNTHLSLGVQSSKPAPSCGWLTAFLIFVISDHLVKVMLCMTKAMTLMYNAHFPGVVVPTLNNTGEPSSTPPSGVNIPQSPGKLRYSFLLWYSRAGVKSLTCFEMRLNSFLSSDASAQRHPSENTQYDAFCKMYLSAWPRS